MGESPKIADPLEALEAARVLFETADDYRQGDEALNAMPADETPGKRTAVAKYDVAFRMTS